jgi:hypothetical protein
MTMPDEKSLARLARRLAIPERAPDDVFVHHVALAMEARAIAEEASRERRSQAILEVAGGAGLLVAAHQFSGLAGNAAALLEPVATSLGGLALLGVAAVALITALAAGAEQREPA